MCLADEIVVSLIYSLLQERIACLKYKLVRPGMGMVRMSIIEAIDHVVDNQ